MTSRRLSFLTIGSLSLAALAFFLLQLARKPNIDTPVEVEISDPDPKTNLCSQHLKSTGAQVSWVDLQTPNSILWSQKSGSRFEVNFVTKSVASLANTGSPFVDPATGGWMYKFSSPDGQPVSSGTSKRTLAEKIGGEHHFYYHDIQINGNPCYTFTGTDNPNSIGVHVDP